MSPMKLPRRIHTERRTPTPANITLAGENSYHINMRKQISDDVLRHTRLTPALSDSENE
jgi:hypothetical protein